MVNFYGRSRFSPHRVNTRFINIPFLKFCQKSEKNITIFAMAEFKPDEDFITYFILLEKTLYML